MAETTYDRDTTTVYDRNTNSAYSPDLDTNITRENDPAPIAAAPIDRRYEVLDADDEDVRDETLRNGIDNDPYNDAEKGATLGGIGGAVVGAIAGAAAGPVGSIAGAVIGGLAGGAASGAAVGAIDRHDNDGTVSGLGSTNPYANSADTTPVTTPAYSTLDDEEIEEEADRAW